MQEISKENKKPVLPADPSSAKKINPIQR